jgi:hypothetical protein
MDQQAIGLLVEVVDCGKQARFELWRKPLGIEHQMKRKW